MVDPCVFSYQNPVRIHFGAREFLSVISSIIPKTEVALVYGQRSLVNSGTIQTVREALSGSTIHEYPGIGSNPTVEIVEDLVENLVPVQWMIGIGGGSVLDAAKAAAFLKEQRDAPRDLIQNGVGARVNPSIPFVAVPTTSGTGSEVTPWATIWDNDHGRKYSLSHRFMYPEHAIIDPSLICSVPPYVTAYTAFDALAHSLEAFWARSQNPVSDLYAVEAIRLILNHIPRVMSHPESIEDRAGLALGSLLAGLAFSNTSTAAVHSVSYPMTLHYGVPHGVACSLTLAEFWLYNLPVIPVPKVDRFLSSLDVVSPDSFAELLRATAGHAGLPITLSGAGIPRAGIERIAAEGFHPQRMGNNPRPITRDELVRMLERIYE